MTVPGQPAAPVPLRRAARSGGPLSRLRAPSLVVRFAVLSLAAIVGLGVVLAVEMHQLIDRRARAEAERMALVTTRLVFSAVVAQVQATAVAPPPTGDGRPGPRALGGLEQLVLWRTQIAAVGSALNDPVLQGDLLGSNAWLPGGTVVFSSDPDLEGRRATPPRGVAEAFAGRSSTAVVTDRRGSDSYIRGTGPALVVYTPIVLPGGDRPVAVAEMALPYQPIQDAVNQDMTRTVAALALGLVVLWLVLFRVVHGASRRLQEQSDTNRQLALHDTLTGLPNRSLLRDRMVLALARARRNGTVTGLLLLDLDRFKEINDTLGHVYGDGLLIGVARRLEEVVREADTAARLSGDEFAVLVADQGDAEAVHAVATRIQQALHRSFLVEGVTLDVEASIGIALAPLHGDDMDTLLRCADVAMYAAKGSQTGIETYDSARDENTPARLALLGDLRRALDEGGQLQLHYQPKVSLDGNALAGAEALLRWYHPTRGLVPPADFIPVAEGTGLIHPLTMLTLSMAIAQVEEWKRHGREVPVAVNISTRCLLDVDLPAKIQSLLSERDVPPSLLRLEITESTLMADPTRALSVLNQLSALGVRLSIDDFGTGFSSMSYLKRLPIDELKVDRSFVTDMTTQPADLAVVRSVVELGHNLGLHVVAEGVETDPTATALSALGCDVAQGYLYARPMPAADLAVWLEQNDPTGATAPAP